MGYNVAVSVTEIERESAAARDALRSEVVDARPSRTAERAVLAALLVLYLACACGFSLVTPYGEAPDEYGHVGYVEYLARYGKLPPISRPYYTYESFQMPLYYMMGAAMVDTGRVLTSKKLDALVGPLPVRLDPGLALGRVVAVPTEDLVREEVEILVDPEAAAREDLVERDAVGLVGVAREQVVLDRVGEPVPMSECHRPGDEEFSVERVVDCRVRGRPRMKLVGGVALHGAGAQEERRRDLPTAPARREQPQHLHLPPGQLAGMVHPARPRWRAVVTSDGGTRSISSPARGR